MMPLPVTRIAERYGSSCHSDRSPSADTVGVAVMDSTPHCHVMLRDDFAKPTLSSAPMARRRIVPRVQTPVPSEAQKMVASLLRAQPAFLVNCRYFYRFGGLTCDLRCEGRSRNSQQTGGL